MESGATLKDEPIKTRILQKIGRNNRLLMKRSVPVVVADLVSVKAEHVACVAVDGQRLFIPAMP